MPTVFLDGAYRRLRDRTCVTLECGSSVGQEVGLRGVETGYLHPTARRRSFTSSQELIMALDFRSKTTKIPQTTGARSENEGQPFGKRLRTADVALKSFKLDYVGGARPSDIAQVTVRLQSIGDEDVQYNVTTNYSGGTYTGEVTVLIIADTEDKPGPIH
jgi:hypothetical protein